MPTATATRTPKDEKPEPVEAPPKYPPGSNEATALEKLRAHYTITPGPLPPIGASPDGSTRRRAAMLGEACRHWAASGHNPGYFTRDTVKDSESLGKAIVEAMKATVERHGRAEVGNAIGEWLTLAGRPEARPVTLPDELQRAAGELAGIEKRLGWLNARFPATVAAHWPTPFGPLGKALHARRRDLITLVDNLSARSHDPGGAAVLDEMFRTPFPGSSVVVAALESWGRVAEAVANGAMLPEGFAADWSEVVPAAADSFSELGELSVYVLRFN